eukprot:813155_1
MDKALKGSKRMGNVCKAIWMIQSKSFKSHSIRVQNQIQSSLAPCKTVKYHHIVLASLAPSLHSTKTMRTQSEIHMEKRHANASDNNNTDINNTTSSNNNEIRMTLSMPIIAQCMMIEFSAFHENDDSESCICPWCAAPGNSTGYCQNCGENLFQCRKCRHI